MSALDFLRDVGKHFRVNQMVKKEADRGAAEQRRGHLLHRVQLPAAAGARLPAALPRLRLHAADRRAGPVGQPHRRLRPDPPGRGRVGAPADDAAAHRRVGREVRQERGQRHLAVGRDDQPVRLLPVLAQRRGRLGAHAAAGVHRPHPRGDRRARAPGGGGAVPAGGAEDPRRRRDHPGARRRRDGRGAGRQRGAVRQGRPARARRAHPRATPRPSCPGERCTSG